jgi:hypothetical protein
LTTALAACGDPDGDGPTDSDGIADADGAAEGDALGAAEAVGDGVTDGALEQATSVAAATANKVARYGNRMAPRRSHVDPVP